MKSDKNAVKPYKTIKNNDLGVNRGVEGSLLLALFGLDWAPTAEM